MNQTTAEDLSKGAGGGHGPFSDWRAAPAEVEHSARIGGWGLVRLSLHILLIVLAILCAKAVGSEADGGKTIWIMLPLIIAMLAFKGTYRRPLQLDVEREVVQTLLATSLAAVAVVAVIAIFDPNLNPAPLMLRGWLFTAAFLCGSAPLIVMGERRARRAGTDMLPTLVVGAGQVGTQIERRLSSQPELGLRVVGYIDADPVPKERVPERRAPVLGSPDEFVGIAEETGAKQVILTFTSSPDHVLVPLIRACEERGIYVSMVPRMFESVNLRLSLDNIGPLPLFNLKWVDPKGWQFAIKHAIDRVVSFLLIVLMLPVLISLAIAVRVSSPGPVLYRQRRIGRDGRRFDILKFRSMRLDDGKKAGPGPNGDVAPGGVEGDDRRTAVGSFIRRYSLDELPQLFNVLKGQMSLIGPRPERPEFVEVFDEEVRRYSDRHRVKSGITGLAQVSGYRGKTSLPERVELDNYYIQNWSMGLDLKIAFRTFAAVLEPAE
jgi:exopolysaccharide biosynthesis polyprenyl glycosylphosphotransferase